MRVRTAVAITIAGVVVGAGIIVDTTARDRAPSARDTTWGEGGSSTPTFAHTYPSEPRAGEVLDLCDDDDALAAGLDGGDLAAARAAMGVDCTGESDTWRYVVLDANGEPWPADAADRASAAEPWSTELGSYTTADALDGRAAAAVGWSAVPGSLTSSDGQVRGLITNATPLTQTDVSVSVGADRARLPMPVLPGETVAFAVALAEPNRAHEGDVAVESTPQQTLPFSRAFLVDAAPGLVHVERGSEYLPSGVEPPPGGEGIPNVFATVVSVAATGDPELDGALRREGVARPRAMFAWLDRQGAVVRVDLEPLWSVETGGRSIDIARLGDGDRTPVGITSSAIPDGAESLALWVYGS